MVSLTREAMFVAKALEYTLRRVVLLTVNRSVLLQNTVDDIREGGQISAVSVAGDAKNPAVPNAACIFLTDLARNTRPTCRLSLAQTINMAGQPNAQI